jgi:hypothetical protein
MFQVLRILKPLPQKLRKKTPAKKQEGNDISNHNYLKQVVTNYFNCLGSFGYHEAPWKF